MGHDKEGKTFVLVAFSFCSLRVIPIPLGAKQAKFASFGRVKVDP